MNALASSHAPSISAQRVTVFAAISLVVLLALGVLAPKWLVSLATLACANALVSLGILIMMRSGVVPFGQGLVFAAGGYAAALAFNKLGLRDAAALCLLGGVAGLAVAAPTQEVHPMSR